MVRSALVLTLMLLGSAVAIAGETDEVVASFRILHHNMLGRDKHHCETRYRALADHILAANPPYDIVTFNEHWKTHMGDLVGETCDADVLSDALFSDGRYQDGPGADRHRRSYPNPNFYQLGGGNSVFTTHRISYFDSWKFSNTNNIPVAGFMLSRIELAPGIQVDLWTTHFEATSDGCYERCHETEIRDLARQIRAAHAANPVLIAGDLNIGGPISESELHSHLRDPNKYPYTGNPGYDFLTSYLLGPRDLWLETHPDPIGDDGYTYDQATNPIADPDGRERIDYLLSPTDPIYVQGSPYVLRVRKMEIVHWKTPDGAPVSDHYGLDAQLDLVRAR